MKNCLIYVLFVFMILLTACDRDTQVDYHTLCYYYIDNKTDVDYFVEFETAI